MEVNPMNTFDLIQRHPETEDKMVVALKYFFKTTNLKPG